MLKLSGRIKWPKCSPKTVVLTYHGIRNSKFDPYHIRVSPEYFESHLEWIQSAYPVLSLGEFVLRKKQGGLPKRSVVLTFDDGYENHYTAAKPVLEKWKLPAVFYISTGTIESQKGFWWDFMEALMPFLDKLPPVWEFEAGGKRYGLRFEKDAAAFEKASRSGNVNDLPPEMVKNLTLLSKTLRDLESSEREAILEDLSRRMGYPELISRRQNVLSEAQIKQMAANSLFEIGAHTVSHRTLSALHPEEQRSEIRESKSTLEKITGKTIRHFAYPFGTKLDYDSRAVKFVKQAGFESAVTTELCWGKSGVFEIPRVCVSHQPLELFRNRIEAMFHG